MSMRWLGHNENASWDLLAQYIDETVRSCLKSEVAIASLLYQTKQTKKSLLEVRTITKSPGLLSLSNMKKAEFSGFKA